MYSPYVATVVFAVLQLVVFMVATGMHSCLIEGTTKMVYYAVMVAVAVLEVLLLFSITMGVGASGYDSSTKNCFLLQ
jgi:bacteriorhodopsin